MPSLNSFIRKPNGLKKAPTTYATRAEKNAARRRRYQQRKQGGGGGEFLVNQGPFTLLYRTNDQVAESEDKLENLCIRTIADADVLEIFANDGFALATMVYSPGGIGPAAVSAFADGGPGSAFIEDVTVWNGLSSTRK
ncbi:hypothetical protein BDV33DRAFT_199682 [Aspergillus novoparasiticus]|uniref:Glycosyl hydrolase family 32 C-terminal domain-containing protein n=1 Tax=Aspergillus novoparasiticus TaxID=986946 RepID=A0A5N6F3R5_9EURO|nr:hypothetical protein BDV33DRAFT_199682 [Aspergillus novoparasiticus]